jgi:hypothetical protein
MVENKNELSCWRLDAPIILIGPMHLLYSSGRCIYYTHRADASIILIGNIRRQEN